jgi:hypothetical protein
MPTHKKSDSARANGSKSKGPKTAEGKAKSSKNAVTHGLTADFTVLDHESQDDFQILLDAHVDRFQPADDVELELVHALAITRWRIRRIAGLETELLENQVALCQQEISGKFDTIGDAGRAAYAFEKLADDGKAMALLIRYETSLARLYERTAKQLEQLQNRPLRNEPTEPLTPDPKPTSPPRCDSPEPQPEAEILNRELHEPAEPPPADSPQWEKAA